MTVSGWIFDAYPLGDRMVFWIKDENGHSIRLEDSWTPSIYVGSDGRADLDKLASNLAVQHYVRGYDFVSRYERIRDHERSTVLELVLSDARKSIPVANTIEDIDVHEKFRLYNVETLPPQSYFYEHDLFPLAQCRIDDHGGRLAWQLTDDVRFTDYRLPEFKVMHLDVTPKQCGRLPSFEDKIDTITIRTGNETISIQARSEEDTLNDFMREVGKSDPDFIVTSDGDEFVFPYLIELALSKERIMTDVFSDPVKAFKHFSKYPNDYALIITDIRMPDINGWELIATLLSTNDKLQVIIMSAFLTQEPGNLRDRFSKDDMLEKPFHMSALIKRVKEKLAVPA